MAPIYWGQLPAPNEPRRNSIITTEKQRVSNGLAIIGTAAGDRSSYSSSSHWQAQPSRFSTQTQDTDVPTISTQSPFASPVASEFTIGGLAPRPPSVTYGSAEFQQDATENLRQQWSWRGEKSNNGDPRSLVLPPTAPDVPRAPPVSYRQIFNDSGPVGSQGPLRPRSTRRPQGPVFAGEPQKVLRRKPMNGEKEIVPNGNDINGVDNGRRPSIQLERADYNNGLHSRKASITDSEAVRRREWAPDRSPLQILERTLDSITKEEKRARVEEAELRAKEAETARAVEKPTQNSVQLRNWPAAKAPEPASQQPKIPEVLSIGNIGKKLNEQIERNKNMNRGRAIEAERPSTNGHVVNYGVSQPRIEVSQVEKSIIQTREPSIQDRTFNHSASVAFASLAALDRSAKNSFKKNPLSDSWLSDSSEAEQNYPEVVPPNESVSAVPAPSRDTAFRSHPQLIRDKELPTLPEEIMTRDSSKVVDLKPVRRGTLSKIQRLTGEKFLSHSAKREDETLKEVPTVVVTIDGFKYTAPPISETNATAKKESNQIENHHRFSRSLPKKENVSGQMVYKSSARLEEWKQGGVAQLSGTLLDLEVNELPNEVEKDRAWWESGNAGPRRSSTAQRKAEAYDGEYDDNAAPTRFKPPLFLKSGPMLRYCGLRTEVPRSRSRNPVVQEREIWRGSVMIVTQDTFSSYELAPTLRLFVQPMDLLPPPPAKVDGTGLAPEYIDPLAGLPRIGRDGRTLYVRPVEELDEGKDLSAVESDEGLYEMNRTQVDGAPDPKCYKHYDGEKAGKYKDVRGFRLHNGLGMTFWRFNIEIELRETQQRIAYRINRGPATGFWVPPRGEAMNIMFYSCNGFSPSIDPNQSCGPDPMWRDVLNTHQTQPFHVMLGGGDQIYNDTVMHDTTLYKEWANIRDSNYKQQLPFTAELQNELEEFYLNRYCMWFSQGLFGLAVSQIPMVNIYDDHDIIDGFGSYPDDHMRSPVLSGLGAVALKYYMLFQHQSSIDEGENTEPSWILGTQPGPYIKELSRSVFTKLGKSIAFLGLDCRTERMGDEIVSAETYHKVFDRLQKEILKGQTKHLIVLLGVPVAYPRTAWLENILTSRAVEPIKALGRKNLVSKGLLNRMDGRIEILDDLVDHWTARHHKEERNWLIQELQDIAAQKSVRVTILGGAVNLGAIGQFYSNPKLGIPKDRDFRYMPNIISSAIVNSPPSDALTDILNRRNKVHHLDSETDESMIPVFTHDVNGKPRNNKRLLNRRNWCSIRIYDPTLSPPSTPKSDEFVTPPPKRSLLRRLSGSRGPRYTPDATSPHSSSGAFVRGMSAEKMTGSHDNRPPLSNTSFFGDGLPTAKRKSSSRRSSLNSDRPSIVSRSLSLTHKDFNPLNIFRRSSSRQRSDANGVHGYGDESDADDVSPYNAGLRGESCGPEDHDNEYFPDPDRPRGKATEKAAAVEQAPTSVQDGTPQKVLERDQFRRLPTEMNQRQQKNRRDSQKINLKGGLDICLNMEINPKDPAGVTIPYRLLVPALFCEEVPATEKVKRWSVERFETGVKTKLGGQQERGEI